MLNRQKTLIFLLKLAERPVSRMELTKWCFLLRHETASQGGASFYDFVPYKYGPFSFALYQEADKLVAQNYLDDDGEDHWTLNRQLADEVDAPGGAVERDARQLVARFCRTETRRLVDYVYERYPKFTVNSQRRKTNIKVVAETAIYTVGYEGMSIDAFLRLLLESGIRRLVDVRNNPVARRYGFHKSTLRRLAKRLEMDYEHVPELGIKSELRQSLSDQASYERLFDEYEKTTLRSEKDAIERIAQMVSDKPSVLVCMEACPTSCHRSRLAGTLAKTTSLPVIHLEGKP